MKICTRWVMLCNKVFKNDLNSGKRKIRQSYSMNYATFLHFHSFALQDCGWNPQGNPVSLFSFPREKNLNFTCSWLSCASSSDTVPPGFTLSSWFCASSIRRVTSCCDSWYSVCSWIRSWSCTSRSSSCKAFTIKISSFTRKPNEILKCTVPKFYVNDKRISF